MLMAGLRQTPHSSGPASMSVVLDFGTADPVQADIEAVVEMYTAEREQELLSGNPDYVLDAIDNLDTKVVWTDSHKALVPWCCDKLR